MDNEIKPIAGNWYANLANGELFQVVAFDDGEGLLELQHFHGDLEEVTLRTWRGMDVEAAAAPEDWTGPLDGVEKDDLGYDQPATSDTARREIAQDPRRESTQTWSGTADRMSPADAGESGEDRERG
ncbi:MAG: DUF6763 family protein [Woeseia sp.]